MGREDINLTDKELADAEKALEMLDNRKEKKENPAEKTKPYVKEARGKGEDKKKLIEDWIPKTATGKKVKNGEITSIDELIEKNIPILEPEIIDALIPDLEEKMVAFDKTTRVIKSGRSFSFRATVLVGNKNGFIGIGTGKDKERFPAIRKATREAKLSIKKIIRGCGSWECTCNLQHSVPFKTEGKASSVHIVLLPAPKGVGLVVGKAVKEVMELAGIKDVWSYASGATSTKLNSVRASIDALVKTSKVKFSRNFEKKVTMK